ncbi:acetyl-CoA carboxylase, carboxyltransferase subunit beta [Thermogemmatispora sp.]|uniref:acetyl-CoA carboxylase, carboxyltransferase subunit beta n=1 Tax=Thermogemmatispora sp. TaxID=1968838 RepID=UPI0026106AA1|nr:acetyl-CoA carboxylase, carboxyltransferase subunit beta [Thermogemmatispora sp.]
MAKEAAGSSGGPQPERSSGPGVAPDNLMVKCPKCKEILYSRDWEKNLKVCSRCNYHFRLTAHERVSLLLDPGSFVELDAAMVSVDPLNFVSRSQSYTEKLQEERAKVGLNEAAIRGYGTIEGLPLSLAVMDFRFIGGSMGSVVGEKVTRAIELGLERRWPVLVVSTSGGARMQEGFYSLLQMAKTVAALARLSEARIPYFSLITDPTTGGVTASFAMLGDVILAEPGALIAFAGPRVIEQFMHVKLPEGTVNSEFVLQHGMIDAVVHRRELRATLARLLRLYKVPEAEREQRSAPAAQSSVEAATLLSRQPSPSRAEVGGGQDGLRS